MNFPQLVGNALVCELVSLFKIMLASNPLGVMIPAALGDITDER